jgi:DNA-binding NtrC family response regulator
VRELENCIARSVILCKEHTINRDDLPEKMRILNNEPSSILEEGLIRSIPEQGLKIKEMERELILKTLAKCGGNKSLTANFLGISRKALYEKIERHGIGI